MKSWVWIALSLCACALSSQAQSPNREQLVGMWVGVHTEWDTDVFCPLPTYIYLAGDSTYTLGLVDNRASPIRSTWAANDHVIRLDTIRYQPKLVTIHDDQLRIGTHYPMVFRRLIPVSLDSAVVYGQLTGRVWQADGLTMHLHSNGRICLDNLITKQRTIHFWQLVRFGESIFLVIRGNQFNQDGGYKPLWQVVSSSPKQMQLTGWSGKGITTETYRNMQTLGPGDSCKAIDFQTCDNCFARMWYSLAVGHDDLHTLNQLFRAHYQPINQPGQSGLIRIQYVVNCQGERGLFNVASFGDDYCPTTFDSRITDQLTRICREHVPSNLAGHPTDLPNHEPKDSAISLTFRLKDGRLTDILP